MVMQRFTDRMQAGKLLAERLEAYANRPDALVLALPRGGVPVGFALAEALNLPLDILLVRKLGVPGHEEVAMGAIASGGGRIIRHDIVKMLGITDEAIEETTRRERAEMQRRDLLYRAGQPPPRVEGREILLVDDGLATGATMMAAVQALRTRRPARVVVAVPVGAADACRLLSDEADEVVCLRMPEPFHAVSPWYDEFPQTGDREVIDLLERAYGFPRAGNAAATAGRPDAQARRGR